MIKQHQYKASQIMREIAAPILCSNGVLSFNFSELKEGNNEFENGVVFRRGDYFYTAEHCVDEETKKKNRCMRDVCTNDPTVIVGSDLIEIIGIELGKGKSGYVVVQDNKHLLFQYMKGKYSLEYTSTAIDEVDDEGIDDNFRTFATENHEFVKYLGQTFVDYFLKLEIQFMEFTSSNFEELNQDNKESLALLIQQLYEKGDKVEKLEPPRFNEVQFTSNYISELKELIDNFNTNFEQYINETHNYINKNHTVRIQKIITLNSNFWDDHSYRVLVIISLRRCKPLKCHIEKDVVIAT
ncbi:unnamed protein product [Parnassius apollo]|uniref:(apollo) hypothetical protein n=1 Tax=Parnassius apollo TaxID=110799 RepID=A0A8S3XJV3_PARAO|nr:unnamed protein product [Parnassius apollo]